MERSQVIKTLSDSILDLSRRLEVVEDDDDEECEAKCLDGGLGGILAKIRSGGSE